MLPTTYSSLASNSATCFISERIQEPGQVCHPSLVLGPRADLAVAVELMAEGMDDLRVAIRVAELREKRGMTQTELAAKIHTSAAVISRLERGRNVELKTLRKVAAALNARLTVEPLAS